jgi:hypothetical protein
MALGAGGVGAVLGESVADGGGTADIGINRGHDIRRRWRWDAEECFHVTHTPRVTGEVSTPFALTVSTAAMPSRPPRWLLPLRLTF